MATLGHKLDASTFALWRMDEAAGTNVAIRDASSTGYNLSAQNNPGRTTGRIDGGRSFVAASNHFFSGVSNSSLISLLQTGSYTFEGWVHLGSAYQGSLAFFFVQGQSTTAGSTSALLFSVGVSATGKLVAGWAGTVGASFGTISTSTASIPLNQWNHFAARVTVTGGGTTRTLELFLNGALDSTFTSLTAPSAGATGGVRIGHLGTGVNQFTGTLDDFRISSVARTTSEILESYQRGAGLLLYPQGHKLDGNTLALYRMDETEATGSLTDAVGGFSLPLTATGTSAVTGIVGGGRAITASTGRANRSVSSASGLWLWDATTAGSYTIEFWLNLNGTAPGSTQYALTIGNNALTIALTSARTIVSSVGSVGASSAAGAVPLTGWTHIAIRVAVSGADRLVSHFVNGVLSGSTATITPSFTTPGTFYFGASSSSLVAYYDDLRISNIARADAEIFESYNRGIGRGYTKLGHAVDGNTLACWRLDETSGDASSANGLRTLAQANSPAAVTGQIGGGRSIAGTATFRRSVGSDTTLVNALTTGNFTWEGWINLNNVAPGFSFLWGCATNVFAFMTDSTRYIRVYVGSGSVTSAGGLMPIDGWNHYAIRVTVNGSARDVAAFVNGVSVYTASITPSFSSVNFLHLGSSGGSNSNSASVDDVRISNVARSDAEILESWQRGMGIIDTNVVPVGRALNWPRKRSGWSSR